MDAWESDILRLEEDVADLEREVMRPPRLFFQRIHKDAQLPKYATPLAAGMDVTSVEEVEVYPGDRKAVATGLRVMIPAGWELQVRPRSGLALKNGITVLNSPGTIDADYRGEVKVILYNVSKIPYDVLRVKVGDRIAQLVVARAPQAEIIDFGTADFPDTQRGSGGFGSTGS